MLSDPSASPTSLPVAILIHDNMGYYVNPASFYAVNILFLVLCPIAVFLRFTIRHAKKVPYGADDWCALVALVRDPCLDKSAAKGASLTVYCACSSGH